MEKKHPTARIRAFGLAALAGLAALVGVVSSSSADAGTGSAAPAALSQPAGTAPIQDTTPETTPERTPPADGDRRDRDCPKEDGERGTSASSLAL